MTQYDAHANVSPTSGARLPLLLDVQADAFGESRYRLVVPLMPAAALRHPDARLNPVFEVDGEPYVLLPLDLASLPVAALGPVRARLGGQGDRIIAALDLVLARS